MYIKQGLTKGRKPPSKLNQAKDPVHVFCRIRPLHDAEEDVCITPISSTVVQLSPPSAVAVLRNGMVKETQYTFKHIFNDSTTQNELFSHTTLPLVDDLLNGKNGLLLTYGVTGSGKTFTMTGTPQNGGILPRCLDVIFNSIGELQANKYVFKSDKMNGFDIQSEEDAKLDRHKDMLTVPRTSKTAKRQECLETEERVRDTSKIEDIDMDSNYSVFVQYVEIYNNYVYDLLEEVVIDPVKPRPPQSKMLREDCFHNMYIHGCTEIEVKSTDEAFEAFYKGQRRRRVAHTSLNTESSRSHSVFTIRLAQAPLDLQGEAVLQEKGAVCISQLSLVDLAGSERSSRTRNCGDRLREAGNINNSLMVLRACMEILRENQMQSTSKMVPFRDSKLTHLFKNYFDGEGKVRMVVCVNPSMADYDENVHIMRFAELTQEVQITRPAISKPDLGLTPGRRRANLIYKDAIERLNEMKALATPRSIYIPTAPPLTPYAPLPKMILPELPIFRPDFPDFELQDPTDDHVLPKLVDFLEEYVEEKARKAEEMDIMETNFRCNLINLERENIQLKCELESSNKRLKTAESQNADYEQKLIRLQKRFDMCEQDKRTLQREVRNLEREVDIKDVQLNRCQVERVSMKAKLEDKRMLERKRSKLEMEKVLKEKEGRLKAKMFVTNARLRTMREIVSDKWVPPQPGKSAGVEPVVSRNPASVSDPKITTEPTPRRRQRSVSPQPLTNVAIANPKHRRSQSVGPVWIDHTPKGTIKTGTIIRPILKNKKSLTKLDVKDLKRDASKYVLTHQEQDFKGDVKTSLFKGNVIPSAGGGAQVIFNDVEIMQHEIPGTRKRCVDGQQKTMESSGN